MTDYLVNILRSPIPAPAGAAAKRRDPLLESDNDGVRFAFDLDFSWSYPGGDLETRPAPGNPTAGQTIYDIAERGNGAYQRQGSTPVASYAGGGFDFDGITRTPYGVKAPASAWSTIYSAANRYFLWCGYYRMPSSSNWKASNGSFEIFTNTEANGSYISQVEPLTIFQITPTAGNPKIIARRQVLVGASPSNATVLELPMTGDYFGKLCQVAFWRNASGQGFRIKSADNEASATAAVGTETALNFSATRPTWGNGATPDNGDLSAENKNAVKYRLYRGFLEDLALSNRNPLDVINGDWTRVQARIAASAAANGGTSVIFV